MGTLLHCALQSTRFANEPVEDSVQDELLGLHSYFFLPPPVLLDEGFPDGFPDGFPEGLPEGFPLGWPVDAVVVGISHVSVV